jgi:hypothetical protein
MQLLLVVCAQFLLSLQKRCCLWSELKVKITSVFSVPNELSLTAFLVPKEAKVKVALEQAMKSQRGVQV